MVAKGAFTMLRPLVFRPSSGHTLVATSPTFHLISHAHDSRKCTTNTKLLVPKNVSSSPRGGTTSSNRLVGFTSSVFNKNTSELGRADPKAISEGVWKGFSHPSLRIQVGYFGCLLRGAGMCPNEVSLTWVQKEMG